MAVNLKSVRDRISDTGAWAYVTDAESASVAMETSAKTPAAFVAVANETASPNRTLAVHDQTVDCTIAVLLCLATQRADSERQDRVEEARLGIIAALTGWTPDGARKALDYVGYRIAGMGGGLIWIECTFKTSWQLRK